MNKKSIKLIIHSAAICVTALTFSMNANASDKPKITSSTTTNAISTLTDQEKQAVSQAAARVLFHTERAQTAIADKKEDVALKQIKQGIKLIRIIKSTVPKYKVSTQISSAGIKYKTSDIIAQRYVIVSDNSFVENIITPVIQKKNKSPHKVAQAPIEDFSLSRRMTITLDTLVAGRMLNVAKDELIKGKLTQAAKALSELQNHGVILNSIEVPLPLASAVDNLYLAQTEISTKHYQDANATLKDAVSDLKAYETITGNTHSNRIHEIVKGINKLTSEIDHQKNGKKIEDLIKSSKGDIATWWHDVKSWVEKR